MGHPTSKFVLLSEVARLLGYTHMHATRLAKNGEFGPGFKKPGSKRISYKLEELENRRGFVFSPEQIERAVFPTRRSLPPKPYKMDRVPPAVIALIWTAACKTWRPVVASAKAGRDAPEPDMTIFKQVIKDSGLVTLDQLARALNSALEQRDIEWRDWAHSRPNRALHPQGPIGPERYDTISRPYKFEE